MKVGMELTLILAFIFTLSGGVTALWNNLNCPAPRSPDNGLNFIFRNGELVHFRCHPGFYMRGKAIAYCVNSQWTVPAPDCLPIRKDRRQELRHPEHSAIHDDSNYYNHESQPHHRRNHVNNVVTNNREEQNSKLFNWESKHHKKTGAYGDGPRRLPLINGIWSQPAQVLTLGQQSTPGPLELVKEEVDIAELRNQQLEEVEEQRLFDPEFDSMPKKRRKGKKHGNKKRKNIVISDVDVDMNAPRETVISLGATIDGDALSVAHAKQSNDSNGVDHHKYRHRDARKKKRKGKGKKWRNHQPYSTNMIARASRVDTSGLSPYAVHYHRNQHSNSDKWKNEVAELRGRPIEKIKKQNESEENAFSEFDTSCTESLYGRDVPKIAQEVPHAFVYRYETKKNRDFPFNSYMQVKYRCLSGYSFADIREQVLNCREGAWVGEVPRCDEIKV